jgi:hypothetical protein
MVLREPGFTYNLLFTQRFYWLASFGKNRPAPPVDPAFRFVLPFLHCTPAVLHLRFISTETHLPPRASLVPLGVQNAAYVHFLFYHGGLAIASRKMRGCAR